MCTCICIPYVVNALGGRFPHRQRDECRADGENGGCILVVYFACAQHGMKVTTQVSVQMAGVAKSGGDSSRGEE